MKKGVLILLLVIFFGKATSAETNEPPFVLSEIEKKYLTLFFNTFFVHEDFSYTLFGKKPMSFSGLGQKNENDTFNLPDIKSLSLLKSICLLKKLRGNFSANFIFILNNIDRIGCNVFFINKSMFINVVEKNKDLFRQKLGEDFDVEKFLEVICEEKIPLLDLINNDDVLLGILLGYGRENAESFYTKEKLDSFSEAYDPFLTFVYPLGFGCKNGNAETIQLHQEYEKTREEIIKAYTSDLYLDVILDKLQG